MSYLYIHFYLLNTNFCGFHWFINSTTKFRCIIQGIHFHVNNMQIYENWQSTKINEIPCNSFRYKVHVNMYICSYILLLHSVIKINKFKAICAYSAHAIIVGYRNEKFIQIKVHKFKDQRSWRSKFIKIKVHEDQG